MPEVGTTLSSLSQDTPYAIRVRAIGPLGSMSEWSDPIVVTPGVDVAEDGTDGNDAPDPPSGVVLSAAVDKLLLSWARPPANLKHWEIYVSDSNENKDESSAEDESGNKTPKVDGSTFYGTARSTILSIGDYCAQSEGGDWRKIDPQKQYWVGIKSVAPNDTVSPIVWVSAQTGSLNDSYFQAGTITAGVLAASTITSELILGGSIKTAANNNGSYVDISPDGIIGYGKSEEGSPKRFEFKTEDGTAYFRGKIEMVPDEATPGRQFHVNEQGRLWLGATDYDDAPFKIENNGNVTLSGGADITVLGDGVIVVGSKSKRHIRMQQPTSDEAHIRFHRSSAVAVGMVQCDVAGVDDVDSRLRIGSHQKNDATSPTTSDLDLLAIGLCLDEDSNRSSIRFYGQDHSSYDNIPFQITVRGNEALRFEDPVSGTNVLKIFNLPTGSQSTLSVDSNGKVFKATSSRKYKEDIQALTSTMDYDALLQKMEPVSFVRKGSGMKEYGFIAEQINEVDPTLVIFDNEGEPDSIMFFSLLPILVGGYQQMAEKVKDLEEKLNARGCSNCQGE